MGCCQDLKYYLSHSVARVAVVGVQQKIVFIVNEHQEMLNINTGRVA